MSCTGISRLMDTDGILNLARKTAGSIDKPTDIIKVPYESKKKIPVEVQRDVSSGFWIFKSTHKETHTEMKDASGVEFRDEKINGWILYTFYEYCDEIERTGVHAVKDRSVAKYFYVLKKNGDLSVYKLFYSIYMAGSDHEKLEFDNIIPEKPMTFNRPGRWSNGKTDLRCLVEDGSAYILDYNHTKWENKVKRSDSGVAYFSRNFPLSEGNSPSIGEATVVQQPGGGLIRALNRLANKYQTGSGSGSKVENKKDFTDVTKQFDRHTVSVFSLASKKYVFVGKDHDNSPVLCDTDSIFESGRFIVEVDNDGWASFKASNGYYLSVNLDEDKDYPPIRAIGPRSMEWEKFKIFCFKGHYAIKAGCNDKWITCRIDWENKPLYATRDKVELWEEFEIDEI